MPNLPQVILLFRIVFSNTSHILLHLLVPIQYIIHSAFEGTSDSEFQSDGDWRNEVFFYQSRMTRIRAGDIVCSEGNKICREKNLTALDVPSWLCMDALSYMFFNTLGTGKEVNKLRRQKKCKIESGLLKSKASAVRVGKKFFAFKSSSLWCSVIIQANTRHKTTLQISNEIFPWSQVDWSWEKVNDYNQTN